MSLILDSQNTTNEKKTLFFKEVKVPLLLIAISICFGFFSCTKSKIDPQQNDGIKHYRILVTWTGNPANLKPGRSGPPYYGNPPQDVGFNIQESNGGVWCCMLNGRDSTSGDRVGYSNDDFLAHDSLWSYTQEKVDSISITPSNYGGTPDDNDPAIPPYVKLRLRIFLQNSTIPKLDTTFVMLRYYFGGVYNSFSFYPNK